MITLIGTGHVFKLREKVKEKIIESKPTAVCLELDERRYHALLEDKIALSPLSLFQQSMAAIYGERAGNDMMGDIEGSKDVGAELFFIDREIEETMSKLICAGVSEFFNPMEIMRKFCVMLSVPMETPSFMESLLSPLSFKDSLEKAVKEFETDPEKYRDSFGSFYPFYKRVLLDEREEYMAKEVAKTLSPRLLRL